MHLYRKNDNNQNERTLNLLLNPFFLHFCAINRGRGGVLGSWAPHLLDTLSFNLRDHTKPGNAFKVKIVIIISKKHEISHWVRFISFL